jgi:PadR family transcriptional regulator, regulatory protein PadR
LSPRGTPDLLQGTLDLMVLKTLALGPNHGVGVARRIQQLTRGTFHPQPGSLFPALHRLEESGYLTSEWGESENRRRAKYYNLTRAGRRRLETEAANWDRIAGAIRLVLSAT